MILLKILAISLMFIFFLLKTLHRGLGAKRMSCCTYYLTVCGLVFSYMVAHFKHKDRLALEVVRRYCREMQPLFKPDTSTGLKLEPIGLYSC